MWWRLRLSWTATDSCLPSFQVQINCLRRWIALHSSLMPSPTPFALIFFSSLLHLSPPKTSNDMTVRIQTYTFLSAQEVPANWTLHLPFLLVSQAESETEAKLRLNEALLPCSVPCAARNVQLTSNVSISGNHSYCRENQHRWKWGSFYLWYGGVDDLVSTKTVIAKTKGHRRESAYR